MMLARRMSRSAVAVCLAARRWVDATVLQMHPQRDRKTGPGFPVDGVGCAAPGAGSAAITATARKVAINIDCMLRDCTPYREQSLSWRARWSLRSASVFCASCGGGALLMPAPF